MARGLLGRLGASSVQQANQFNELDSIVEHLRALLNTRQGEAPAANDFGVVDFTDLVHNFPEAIQTLQRCIRATLLQYEPRLKNVQVHHVRDDEALVLKFQITGQVQIRGARGNSGVRFETQLRAGGHMSVSR
jgi:type VI secretion system protein